MEDRPPPTYEEAMTSQSQASNPTPLISNQNPISDPSEIQGISKDSTCNYIDSQPQPQCYIPQEISNEEKGNSKGCQSCLECCDFCSSIFLCCAIFECCKDI